VLRSPSRLNCPANIDRQTLFGKHCSANIVPQDIGSANIVRQNNDDYSSAATAFRQRESAQSNADDFLAA
jgi:hypothetical protein